MISKKETSIMATAAPFFLLHWNNSSISIQISDTSLQRAQKPTIFSNSSPFHPIHKKPISTLQKILPFASAIHPELISFCSSALRETNKRLRSFQFFPPILVLFIPYIKLPFQLSKASHSCFCY